MFIFHGILFGSIFLTWSIFHQNIKKKKKKERQPDVKRDIARVSERKRRTERVRQGETKASALAEDWQIVSTFGKKRLFRGGNLTK